MPAFWAGILCAAALAAAAAPDTASGGHYHILYTGQSEAVYGTCGCKVNPAGGTPRIANYSKEYSLLNGPVLLVDAGNFSSVRHREQRFLSEYYIRFMGPLHYAAVNVGPNEMKHGVQFLKRVNAEVRLPFLSTNLKDAKGKPLFEPSLKVKYNGKVFHFFGVADEVSLSPEDSGKVTVADPAEALAAALRETKKGEKDVFVLLACVHEPALKALLARDSTIDLVICADLPRYGYSGQKLGRTVVVSSEPQTRNLRGLAFDLLNGGLSNFHGFQKMLVDKYAGNKAVDGLISEYEKALSAQKFEWPRPSDAEKIYAGEAACLPCHAGVAERWKSDAHRNAFQPLLASGDTYNPRCLKCHVTGYERENGFWDAPSSMDMAGVQCESCHGPQERHVQEEKFLATAVAEGKTPGPRALLPHKIGFYACSECHVDQYKLKVKPEEAWKQFGHSKS